MTTTSTPFTPALAACHAGQSARSELDAAKASENDLYRRGRRILRSKSEHELAAMLKDVHAAMWVAQALGFRYADKVDLDALEDAAAILRNAGRG